MQRSYFIPNALGRLFLLVMLALVVLPIALLAQIDTTAVPMPVVHTWQDALVFLIPFLVPMLIGLTKQILYKEDRQPDGSVILVLPTWLPKWMLPVLAPFLGMLASYLLYLAGAGAGNALLGAMLGAVGVFVREVFKPLIEWAKTA